MKQGPAIHVRDARNDERETMLRITLEAYEEYASIMPGPIWKVYRQQLVTALDENGPAERLLAVHGDTVVGSVLLYPAQAQAYKSSSVAAICPEVRLLAVLPDVRGYGVGRALMDECARRAGSAGATMLGLHTIDQMQAAQRLYARLGFVHIPEMDFSPVQGVVIKGYHLDLANRTPEQS